MKENIIQFGIKSMCLITGVLLLLTTTAAPLQGEMTVDQYPEFVSGDYFKYDLNEDQYIDTIGEDFGGDNYTGFENVDCGDGEFKVTGEEMVTVDGVEYSCTIMVVTWGLNFTLLFKENSTDYDDDMITLEFFSDIRSWNVKSNQTEVKSKEILNTVMRFKMNNESYVFKTEETTKKSYSSITGEEIHFPAAVGNTWSQSSTFESNITERSKINDDDWDVKFTEEEVTETKEYEILGENTVTVQAGTFNCFKIKSQEQGDSNYSMEYYNENGIPVKMLDYDSSGNPTLGLELKEYEMENEDAKKDTDDEEEDEDEGIPGFEMAAAIGGMIAISFYKKKFWN